MVAGASVIRPTYTISANLRMFAIIYLIATIVVAALTWGLMQIHIALPANGLAIGVFLGCVGAAGYRFGSRRDGDWPRGSRSALALGYTIISIMLSVVLTAPLLLIGGVADQLRSFLFGWGPLMAGLLLVFALMQYVASLALLITISRRGARS